MLLSCYYDSVEGMCNYDIFIIAIRSKMKRRKLFAEIMGPYQINKMKSFINHVGNDILVKQTINKINAFTWRARSKRRLTRPLFMLQISILPSFAIILIALHVLFIHFNNIKKGAALG
ncbi:uncharacterized protein METZ01_LOCUS194845 [marine metagenome]|uniref:Uncharacterized protein n=1 Tax=marine metagenome TaxID=408172 RepID=A0A382DW66_9ZZZZ|tara:strand:- start:846 stop:1199 length:354 start_codon:yes stop_codon:yes gene_type:complete